MSRGTVAALLEIAGMGALVVAGFLIDSIAGWIIGGIGLIVFGLATERGTRPASEADDTGAVLTADVGERPRRRTTRPGPF